MKHLNPKETSQANISILKMSRGIFRCSVFSETRRKNKKTLWRFSDCQQKLWSTFKKRDEEGADGAPALAAVALHRRHVVHHSVLKPSPLLFILLLLWSFLLPALCHLIAAVLCQLHVGFGSCLLTSFGLQDFFSFTGVLPLLQLPHQLLPVLAGFGTIHLAKVGFTCVTTPIPAEEPVVSVRFNWCIWTIGHLW